MKTVLISGASGGIGSEIAKIFAENGYELLLIYNKNEFAIKELLNDVQTKTLATAYKCDLTNCKQIEDMFTKIFATHKTIDCLINCAGVSLAKQIQHLSEDDYNFVMNNNLKSIIMLTKHVTPLMVSQKQGSIINISSMWGVVGASVESLYSASKGAVDSFTLSLAKELGPSGIRVNAICPGLIDTKMNSCYSKEDIDNIIASTPLNRIGTPKDVAELTYFLASEKANFITGQIITIDGGFSL